MMASYLQLFEDFVQKNEVNRASSLPDDEDTEKSVIIGSITDSTNNKAAMNSINNISNNTNKMEHSYTRDNNKASIDVNSNFRPPCKILVRQNPLLGQSNEEQDINESSQVPIPSYNEIATKEAMNECYRISKYVTNPNPEDLDWTLKLNQMEWSSIQRTIFCKVSKILDEDQLGRLANTEKSSEPIQRRILIDKSACRFRNVLMSIAWDSGLTQWLHSLLIDSLPPSYMASYLDILQTLNTKSPVLMENLLFSRPLNVSQELLAPVMKRRWEPIINVNTRKLPKNAIIVIIPQLNYNNSNIPKRTQQWIQYFSNITTVFNVTLPNSVNTTRQPLFQTAEQIVSMTRYKIQELRNEDPTRSILLVGFNGGSSLALQVAMSENLTCVICMGIAFNTLVGTRGAPDDRLLDIKIPILFVIGQNSAKTSIEEIESLREKMHSESECVVIGSADDYLRVPKEKQKLEGATQSMIDAMVVEKISEFMKEVITSPPGPRIPCLYGQAYTKTKASNVTNAMPSSGNNDTNSLIKTAAIRKRKHDNTTDADSTIPIRSKYVPHIGRPRTRPLLNTTNTTGTNAIVSGKQNMSGSSLQGPTTTNAGTKIHNGNAQKKLTIPLGGQTITNEVLNKAIQSLLNDKDRDLKSTITSISTPSTSTTQPSLGSVTPSIINASGHSKMYTNFEVIPQTKSGQLKTSLICPQQKPTVISGVSNTIATGITNTTPIGTKIKMIPSNKFIQLKPPLQSQSKIYTIKPASIEAGNTVNLNTNLTAAVSGLASGQQQQQQQIFTLKSPNGQTRKFVTAVPAAAAQKYTVVKNATGTNTILKLTKKPQQQEDDNQNSQNNDTQLDLSNIIDMPIMFADNEGNLTDAVSSDNGQITEASQKVDINNTNVMNFKHSNSSGVGQFIISQKIIKEVIPITPTSTAAASSISKIPLQTEVSNPVVNKPPSGPTYIINKQFGTNIITKQFPSLRQQQTTASSSIAGTSTRNVINVAEVGATTATATAKIISPSISTTTSSSSLSASSIPTKSNKVIFINRSTMKPLINNPNIVPKYTNVVVTNPKTSATTLVARPTAIGSTNATTTTTLTPVNIQAIRPSTLNIGKQIHVINNTNSKSSNINAIGCGKQEVFAKSPLRNIIVKSANTIKKMPSLQNPIFHGNVTVRKLVNIVPVSKTTTIGPTTTSSSVIDTSINSGNGTCTAVQTAPKIITLNPVNTTISSSPTASNGNKTD